MRPIHPDYFVSGVQCPDCGGPVYRTPDDNPVATVWTYCYNPDCRWEEITGEVFPYDPTYSVEIEIEEKKRRAEAAAKLPLLIMTPTYRGVMAKLKQGRTLDEERELEDAFLVAKSIHHLPRWVQESFREMGITD